jgi:hypothetical protein
MMFEFQSQMSCRARTHKFRKDTYILGLGTGMYYNHGILCHPHGVKAVGSCERVQCRLNTSR